MLFHVWILWERIRDSSVFQSGVVFHWALGGLLFVLGIILKRKGFRLLWGPRAAVFWLLVILLHFAGTAPLPESVSGKLDLAQSQAIYLALPVSFTALVAYTLYRVTRTSPTSCKRLSFSDGLVLAELYLVISPTLGDYSPQRFSRPPPLPSL